MLLCDLNCDMGEGMANDETIMPFITAANIACGYHAGDDITMNKTVLLAKKHGVRVGAHPSFFDRENFGRSEIRTTAEEVYELVGRQIRILRRVAALHGISLHHVKPHGALYNMAAKNPDFASAIVQAVRDTDPALILYGLSGSYLISEAEKAGIPSCSEVFADRRYGADGNLTPRADAGALISSAEEVVRQVLQMVQKNIVTTLSGTTVPVKAETICIHGDGPHAIEFARAIHAAISR